MPITTYPGMILYNATSNGSVERVMKTSEPSGAPDFSPTTDLILNGEATVRRRTEPTNVPEDATNMIPRKISGVFEYDAFPRGGPLAYTVQPGIPITPAMHMVEALGSPSFQAVLASRDKLSDMGIVKLFTTFNTRKIVWKYAREVEDHITSNSTFDPIVYNANRSYPLEYVAGTRHPIAEWNLPYRAKLAVRQFRGSVTEMNPELDPDKTTIMDLGLEAYDSINNGIRSRTKGDYGSRIDLGGPRAGFSGDESRAAPNTPISPIMPYMRMFADRAHNALVTSYNRTKIPIADIEHRKAFRHIFITRPECYLMANGDVPSIQVLNDDDMATCWQRFPHVIRALSPVYVTASDVLPKYANWNWLLSNRVQGLTTGSNTINLVDSVAKTVRGATVTMGKNLATNLGGTLDLHFNDTKYMDVYEMLRIWMLYIHKRRTGSFFPSFNGYQQSNGFYSAGTMAYHSNGMSIMHPYDRALDYCASIYDIVTDETGTKILYWCKYYGVFPVNVSNSMLANDNNMPLTSEAKISATFQYQYKQENIFKNLVEFNFNAGIVDSVGNLRSEVQTFLRNSVPFLYREDGEGGTSYTSDRVKNYIGAASMFTGSPYIVTKFSGASDPWTMRADGKMVNAELCFIPLFYGQSDLNDAMNLGITNEIIPDTETRSISVLQSGIVERS